MRRIAALVLCALMLLPLSGCQPSREALLRQGIKIEELDAGALREIAEEAILSGQTELRLNYLGRRAAVEQAVRDGLWQARESASYPMRRFLAAYDVSCTQERGTFLWSWSEKAITVLILTLNMSTGRTGIFIRL